MPKGFDELFKAARVLLKECAIKNEEDRIIPTLALANHLCHGVPRLVAQKERLVGVWGDGQVWNEEADRFGRRYSGLRPARVARGVLILKRHPVSVRIDRSVAATVSVYPHQAALAEPKEVAAEYGKRLSDAGISCDEQRRVNLSVFFRDDRLELDISPGTVTEEIEEPERGWRIDKASFPHPRLVGKLYTVLCEEFATDLAVRMSSRSPETRNLVPACVAFILSEYGMERSRIHRLLDKHVLCEPGGVLNGNPSRTNQLWNNRGAGAGNNAVVRDPLIDAARTLFYEGHE